MKAETECYLSRRYLSPLNVLYNQARTHVFQNCTSLRTTNSLLCCAAQSDVRFVVQQTELSVRPSLFCASFSLQRDPLLAGGFLAVSPSLSFPPMGPQRVAAKRRGGPAAFTFLFPSPPPPLTLTDWNRKKGGASEQAPISLLYSRKCEFLKRKTA